MIAFGKKMMCDLKNNQPSVVSHGEGSNGMRKKTTIFVRLFPRESQPCSSTRWLLITIKNRGLFTRKNKLCKITEHVGTKTFVTTEAKYSRKGDNVEIYGELKDDILGKFFMLRLSLIEDTSKEDTPVGVLFEGTLARSLQADHGEWEVTHDAMIFKE